MFSVAQLTGQAGNTEHSQHHQLCQGPHLGHCWAKLLQAGSSCRAETTTATPDTTFSSTFSSTSSPTSSSFCYLKF